MAYLSSDPLSCALIIRELVPKRQMGLLNLPPELFHLISDCLEPNELAALLRAGKQIPPILKYILYYREVRQNNHAILAWAIRRQRMDTFRNSLAALHCQCHSHNIESSCAALSALNEALCLASSGGYISFVKLLVDRGADGNTKGRGHATALELARLHRHKDITHILLAAGS
ncbi:hypothetical protein FLAG1_07366 [Fusarium langsethiae]|uniref:F-box domain-containing protein n=1 Tax=Fusarium langsethiae TaxID=179993 RepID=A0A0N0DDJ1_FUSLA|nr:hypothetical protein FLAG1_07366 [Fusarium langsethiae]